MSIMSASTTTAAASKEKEEGNADVPVVKTERVPDSFINHLKRKPFKRLRPLPEGLWDDNSRFVENRLKLKSLVDAIVHLQEDILRQEALKGYAEVGVEFTDDGGKRIFVLPEPDRHG